jgi:hypothetical protein
MGMIAWFSLIPANIPIPKKRIKIPTNIQPKELYHCILLISFLARFLLVLSSIETTKYSIKTLNLLQFVEGRRWCPWVREGLEEARVFAGDEPCHGEERRRASARFYALQSVIN